MKKARDNPNNKRAVAMLKALKQQQGMTLTEMSDTLNSEGFTTSKGHKRHGHHTIADVLD